MKRSPWEWGMTANLSLTEQFDTQQISQYMPLTPQPHWLLMDIFQWSLQQNECSPQFVYVKRLRDNFGWGCGHAQQPKSLKPKSLEFYKHFGFWTCSCRSHARQPSWRIHCQHMQWHMKWDHWVWRRSITLDSIILQLSSSWRDA